MIDGTSLPFFHYRIDGWVNIKPSLVDVLPKIDDLYLEPDKSIYTDFYENIKSSYLPVYARTVLDIIKPYLADFVIKSREKTQISVERKAIAVEDLQFSSMWWQTAFKAQRHPVHNHGGTGWRSVLYVDFDREVHFPTKFYTNYADPWTGVSSEWYPPVQEGDMIIFPAYLKHESPPNESDKKRTIVSYNILGENGRVKDVSEST